jgi:hypothetical protein
MRWASKLPNLNMGRLTVESEDGAKHYIDFSALTGEANSVIGADFSKQVADASVSYAKTHAMIMGLAKSAVYFDVSAACLTAFALLMIAIFTIRTVWILLQK